VGPNRFARDIVTGELVRVSRQEARELRERADAIRDAIKARDASENSSPAEPNAPPIAAPLPAPLAPVSVNEPN
jgi:hypothetical protein